jgi:hypothetical protein
LPKYRLDSYPDSNRHNIKHGSLIEIHAELRKFAR